MNSSENDVVMPIKIDIIILSYAKTEELKQMTLAGIESLLTSEDADAIQFDILVIESDKQLNGYQYPGTKTIYPDVAFGYNRYLNIGIERTTNSYICLCNNDLVFQKGWATELLKAFDSEPTLSSANPYSENFDYDERIKNGDNIVWRDKTLFMDGVLTGWCIFLKRDILKKIGLLDEQFTFWYADSDYDLTLRKHGLRHALVRSSLVTHLFCQSHDLLSDKREELTTGQRVKFEQKWIKFAPLRKAASKIKRLLLKFIAR